MIKSNKPGQKERGNKPMIHLIDTDTIIGMAEVLTLGAKKYEANTWQNVEDPINTHYDALMRHLLAWKNGEINDKESGLSHIKHVLTNAMFLLHHENTILTKKDNEVKQK